MLHEERQSSGGFVEGEGSEASVLLLQRLHELRKKFVLGNSTECPCNRIEAGVGHKINHISSLMVRPCGVERHAINLAKSHEGDGVGRQRHLAGRLAMARPLNGFPAFLSSVL